MTKAMKDIIAKVSPAFSKAAGCMGQSPCRGPGAAPMVACGSKRNKPQNPSARGEFQNSPVDCFERGDALGKRASPCSGHERGLLLPQGSNEKLPDYHNKMHLPGENLRLWLLRERRLCAALGKRVSPCGGHERGLLLPQRSKDILQDADKNCTCLVIMFFQKNVILMRYKCIFKIEFHGFRV